MNVDSFLEIGKIKVFRTSSHYPISSIAVQIVGSMDRRALIIDGSARLDPYWMVRVCKRNNLEEREILSSIIVGRGFTAYQLNDMIDKAKEVIQSDERIIFLGLVDFSSRFLDDDLDEEEGIWLRSKSIQKLRDLVETRELYSAAADPNPEVFQKVIRGEEYGKKCINLPGRA